MATETKGNKMEATKTGLVAIVESDVKQPQTVLDLDNNEDAKITVIYKKYVANDKVPVKDQLAAALKLVSPEAEVVKALLAYAQSKSYQDGKNAALTKGNYLTQQLRSTIVGLMQNTPNFAETGAKECFERWMAGYKAKKPAALRLLQDAQNVNEVYSDL
jgi:hypothetical protein